MDARIMTIGSLCLWAGVAGVVTLTLLAGCSPEKRDFCSGASQACGKSDDCCNHLNNSGYCVNFGEGGVCADSCTSNSDCLSDCCAGIDNGAHVCSPPSSCSKKGIGEPCGSNSVCASGICAGGSGWCTQHCSSDGDCPAGGCALDSANEYVCFPRCSPNFDCTGYNLSGVYCHAAKTIGGFSAYLCST